MKKPFFSKTSYSSQIATFNANYERLIQSTLETPQGALTQLCFPYTEINFKHPSQAIISPVSTPSALNNSTEMQNLANKKYP